MIWYPDVDEYEDNYIPISIAIPISIPIPIPIPVPIVIKILDRLRCLFRCYYICLKKYDSDSGSDVSKNIFDSYVARCRFWETYHRLWNPASFCRKKKNKNFKSVLPLSDWHFVLSYRRRLRWDSNYFHLSSRAQSVVTKGTRLYFSLPLG